MKPLNQFSVSDVIAFVKSVDKRTWVVVLSCGVAFFLMLIFLLIPAWIERPMLRRDIQSMEAQIRQINAMSQKRSGWEADEKVFGELIQKTRERVFTAQELGLLLGQASKMSSESRVDVLASKPLTEKIAFPAPYHLKYVPSGYEFTVQGGYHDLAQLTSRIENHKKLLRIRSFDIVADEKSPGRHVAGLKLWAILAASPTATSATGAAHAKK